MKNEIKVENLNEAIQYQKDTIVSKTLVDKDAGTITLFAFDKEQGLSEHSAPFDAVVYIIDGESEIKISGIKYHLNKGETIIMPANKPHSVKAINKFKMMLIMIKS